MGLFTRRGVRNTTLVCPHCRMLPTPQVFRRARYLLGEQELTCEACNQTSFVTLWRFEGSGHQEKASALTPTGRRWWDASEQGFGYLKMSKRGSPDRVISFVETSFRPDRQTRSVLILSAIVLAIYFPLAFMIASREVFPPWPPGNPIRLLDIQKHPERGLLDGGFAYIARASDLRAFEDADPKAQKSPIIIYENDKSLGPAHSDHYDVEKIGLGRYSHSKDIGILFSTSDNSDPHKNGRAYFVVVPSAER